MADKELLTEAEAAEHISMSVHFLRASRYSGSPGKRTPGPPFLKIGASVRYTRSDLDLWLRERRVDRRGGVAA